jgi:hypothetical protein
MALLEQFPEIIDTESDDQQASQGIGHGMEGIPLDKRDIYEGRGRVTKK